MSVDLKRLRETLGGADLAWLVERARRRLAQGGGSRGSVTLRDPSPAQRAAVSRLLGRPTSRGAALSVDLADLDALLRHAEICNGLAEAVEALTGPLVDARAQRALVEETWTRLFADADREVGSHAALRSWLAELRATGLLRRLCRQDPERARTVLQQAHGVARHLPAPGLPLAELAAAVTGDSHALDPGEPLGTIAVRLAATLGGVESWDGTEARRDAWAAVGVLCDELSAPVLTVNLRGDGESLTGRALRLHAGAGEPYRLTTRQLLREPAVFDPAVVGRRVYVCENPTVVAAVANRLGRASAPLVCLEGQPKTAARLLLDQLAASGVRLAYHGDFDWAGIQIGNLIARRHGAVAWRFSTDDYRKAGGGLRLHGTPISAAWDPGLEAAMIEVGLAVHEEQVLEDLLRDLAANKESASSGGPPPGE